VSTRRIIDSFSFCDEVGLNTLSYNMIGLPFETRSQILDTIKLNARVQPKVAHVSVFYPLPGTKAHDLCEQEGLLTDKHTDSYYEDSVLRQKSVSAEQVRALRNHFDFLLRLYSRCYKLPGVLGKTAEKMADIGILTATTQHILRAWEKSSLKWAKSMKRPKKEKRDVGPLYIIKDGKVKVWGVD
jgi:radical SAM superfamily enzyme YgiQ (UPF0313 family)